MIRIRFASQGVILAQSQPEASGTPKKVLYAVKNSITPQKRFVKRKSVCYNGFGGEDMSLAELKEHCDSVLVLDTETSGLSFTGDEIIEFSAIKLLWRQDDSLQAVSETDEFVRLSGSRRLDPKITQLTGITDEMLRQEGISKQALCLLLAQLLTPRTLIVAYNAQFDLLFLYHLLRKYGDARLLRDQPKLDLLTVYKDRREYPHRLANAIDGYGLADKVCNSHRAIDDVRATVEVMRAMSAEKADLHRYIDLFGYNAKYGVSGPRISSVRYAPQSYLPTAPLYERPFDTAKP